MTLSNLDDKQILYKDAHKLKTFLINTLHKPRSINQT
jgi:hypothetical protein